MQLGLSALFSRICCCLTQPCTPCSCLSNLSRFALNNAVQLSDGALARHTSRAPGPGHTVKHGHPKSEHRAGTHNHDAHPVAEHHYSHDGDGDGAPQAHACAVCGTPTQPAPEGANLKKSDNAAVGSADVESDVASAVAKVRADMEVRIEVLDQSNLRANPRVCGAVWCRRGARCCLGTRAL